jgi:L-ascorbate metabolism protein UlaG (beta-lactamase superfamily)
MGQKSLTQPTQKYSNWSYWMTRWPRLPWRMFRRMCTDFTRGIKPAPLKPNPAEWSGGSLTAAWLGHATVLINFHGVNILTDPVFSARVGLRVPPFTLGPKRYVEPALKIGELPRIDLILLTHAHMDHFDIPSLKRLHGDAIAVTAKSTRDLLAGIRFKQVIELDWDESAEITIPDVGMVIVTAFEVRHWGARMQHDTHRGYNGYTVERRGRRICITGDSAFTSLAHIRNGVPIDLMLAPIGAYEPWIASHCTPKQAVEMANEAGARYIMPIHHQTFKLSFEPMSEPIERFQKALAAQPERIALANIGGTFVLPGDDGAGAASE